MTELIVKQDNSPTYPPRTAYNTKSSDVTLALATDLTTRGEQLTYKLAGEQKYLGFELVDDIHTLFVARQLFKKLKEVNGSTVNIAGNGIYTLIKEGCTQEFINQFVYEIIAQTNHFYPIKKIYTGGQTGVDLAGAVAGYKLGIPTEVTLPQGYIQRHEDNKDKTHTKEEIIGQIEYFSACLHDYTPITKEQLRAKKQTTIKNNSNTSSNTRVETPPNKIMLL